MQDWKILSGSSLFCELPQEALTDLVARATSLEISAGRAIITQGSIGHQMYAVLHGQLKVVRGSEDGDEITLAILDAGDVFGELALLDGGPRSASVVALTPCLLLSFSRETVLGVIERHPQAMRQLLRTLCERLRNTNELAHDLIHRPLPKRLGRLLKELAVQQGEKVRDGIRIELRMTQQEIAHLVGAGREAINKHLTDWIEKGWILRESRTVLVLDPAKLPE